MKLERKKVVVTGSAGGIGKEIVKILLNKEAIVIAVDLNKENLEKLKLEINSERLITYVLDITNDIELNNFGEYCKEQSVDILINNAGIIQPFYKVNELEMVTIEKVMNVNFYAPLKLTKLLLPLFLEKKEAYIINVSSMGGFFPFPGQTVYGASKAALKIFTEGLYAELIDTNVKVTVVFPGAIATDITKNSNVETRSNDGNKNMALSPVIAGTQIVDAIEKEKVFVYIGKDSKFMNFMYKFNKKWAIKFISKKMGDLVK